ncbi:MAG: hypothetical protein A4E35_02344 [Methanoregula sp. PtaU1.Bin051]|nr:MAG: hypothetical protein A4E35_02344 [Methanoregula sp. PtaU1.Bin051]
MEPPEVCQVSRDDLVYVINKIFYMVAGNPAIYITKAQLEQQLDDVPKDTVAGCLQYFEDLGYIRYSIKEVFRLTGQGINFRNEMMKISRAATK